MRIRIDEPDIQEPLSCNDLRVWDDFLERRDTRGYGKDPSLEFSTAK